MRTAVSILLAALVLSSLFLGLGRKILDVVRSPGTQLVVPAQEIASWLLVLGCALFVLRRVSFWGLLNSLGFHWDDRYSASRKVRDRSLGGREVTVSEGRRRQWRSQGTTGVSPLDPVASDRLSEKDLKRNASAVRPSQRQPSRATEAWLSASVPEWWTPQDGSVREINSVARLSAKQRLEGAPAQQLVLLSRLQDRREQVSLSRLGK